MGMKKNNQSIYLNNIHLKISKNFVLFTKKTYSLYKYRLYNFFEFFFLNTQWIFEIQNRETFCICILYIRDKIIYSNLNMTYDTS